MIQKVNAVLENYFIFKGSIYLLGLLLEIDVSIVNAPAAEGGGIHASFTFAWNVGSRELYYLNGYFDFVPFDLSMSGITAAVMKGVKFFTEDLSIQAGIEIRPTFLNAFIVAVEVGPLPLYK